MPTIKKQLDPRIRALLERQIARRHRSFFVVIGDHARDQVANLHYLTSKLNHTTPTAPLTVLWCYKRDLDLSANRKRRMKRLQTASARGLSAPDEADPFVHFVASARVKFAYYKEVARVVGQTFGMVVLQDFEAITANVLAQAIETVAGGGAILLLLNTMSSLKQLYTMTMDIHARFQGLGPARVLVPRFNRRFFLSLTASPACLVLDDELNVMNLTAPPQPTPAPPQPAPGAQPPLPAAIKALSPALQAIFHLCATHDQRAIFASLVEDGGSLAAPTAASRTVAVTAARGRGKSALLGLAIAAAIVLGYANTFVSAPSPAHAQTVFKFVVTGLEAAGYRETTDYAVAQATRAEWGSAVIRVQVFRAHRQTVQFVLPRDVADLGAAAELVVVDEAAAIPAPIVRGLIRGAHLLTLLASTTDGYEGTGRVLAMRLLREIADSALRHRMQTPIRYGPDDPVEAWLNRLLGLAPTADPLPPPLCPPPVSCRLYLVNRDALFSHHAAAERFLAGLLAIFVASHYKNSPNDLQMLADAPGHRLFVLLQAVKPTDAELPPILVALQVAFEGGAAAADRTRDALARGVLPPGDLIPWTLAQQYREPAFCRLRGLRVVRIATHPDLQGMGYGTQAIKELIEATAFAEDAEDDVGDAEGGAAPLLIPLVHPIEDGSSEYVNGGDTSEHVVPNKNQSNTNHPRQPDYIGTSFGLTSELLRFWRRLLFHPLYLRLTPNSITAEHTVVMVRALRPTAAPWLEAFCSDFGRRAAGLLGFAPIRNFSVELAHGLLRGCAAAPTPDANWLANLEASITPHDWERLEAYAAHLVDYHLVLDLVPALAMAYFTRGGMKAAVYLSPAQRLILLGLGLARKSIDEVAADLDVLPAQVMALFNKAIKRITREARSVQKQAVWSEEAGELGETTTAPRKRIPYANFVVPEEVEAHARTALGAGALESGALVSFQERDDETAPARRTKAAKRVKGGGR